MTKLYLDILDKQRQIVFERLEKFREKAILGGGTALALQLHHRKSYDFDLFFSKPIGNSLYRNIQELFSESPIKHLDSSDQLTVQLSSGVQITCLYYWYPPLYEAIQTTSISIFDKRDIATDKAFTLGRRNIWRDYVDIYYLLVNNHITIDQMISDAQKRFGNEFSSSLFLQQICYFNDITDKTIDMIDPLYSEKTIMEYLIQQVKTFTI